MVTRGVLRIGYQARSPKTRDAMVQTYRKLMATTRAVLRDADTMVRRLAQRQRTATATTAAVLHRAQQQTGNSRACHTADAVAASLIAECRAGLKPRGRCENFSAARETSLLRTSAGSQKSERRVTLSAKLHTIGTSQAEELVSILLLAAKLRKRITTGIAIA